MDRHCGLDIYCISIEHVHFPFCLVRHPQYVFHFHTTLYIRCECHLINHLGWIERERGREWEMEGTVGREEGTFLRLFFRIEFVLNDFISFLSWILTSFFSRFSLLLDRMLESSYHGLIKENETFVEIRPLIKVDSSKVCDFHIIKKGNHEVPFEIELVNNLGVLKATKTLNCEKHIIYRFEIAAVMCDGTQSERYVSWSRTQAHTLIHRIETKFEWDRSGESSWQLTHTI